MEFDFRKLIKSRKNMNILLIKPPIEEVMPVFSVNGRPVIAPIERFSTFASQPSGLLKISSYLKKAGHKTHLIDCTSESKSGKNSVYSKKLIGRRKCGNYSNEKVEEPVYLFGLGYDEFREELKNIKKPDLVMVTSSMTYHWIPVHKIIKICKEQFPEVPLVLGGIYATLCSEHAAKSGADQIFCRNITEADDCPADFSVLDYSPEYATIKTTRGCPNRCSYCAVHILEGNGFYFRNPESTFQEIVAKHEKYKIKHFIFWESNLLINANEHFEVILDKIIKRGLDIELVAPEGLQINLVTQKLADKMKMAGFIEIHLPLESTEKSMEKRFHRQLGAENLRSAINKFENAGFDRNQILIFILIGLHGQTLDSIISSLVTVWEEECVPRIMPFTPIPKTEEFENYKKVLQSSSYENLHPLLWPFANQAITVKDNKELLILNRITDPINYFKENSAETKVSRTIVRAIKKSPKIWDNYYKANFEEFTWNSNIPDEIVVDFFERFIKTNKDAGVLKILDVGCSSGKNSLFLKKNNLNAQGIDISSFAIKHLEKGLDNSKFYSGDFLIHDFDENFDIILDIGCLHMIDPADFKNYIKKVHSLLRRNGKYVLRVFAEKGYYNKKFFPQDSAITPKSSFLHFFDKKEIKNLFSDLFKPISFKETHWAISPDGNELVPGTYELIMEKKNV